MRGRIETVKKGNRIIGHRIVIEMPRTERYSEGKTAGRTKKKRLVRSMRGRDYHEAYAEMQRLMADASAGEIAPTGKQTLGQYLDEWLSLRPNLSPKTKQGYEININKHIKPTLGMYKLPQIRPIHIQALYQKLLDSGRAPRTVEYVHATLHAALEQAVEWRMIPFNPASRVEPPRPVRDEQAALMTPKEASRFLKEAQKSRIYELLVLAIHTGMRRGELLALRWEDVDLEYRPLLGVIRIRRNLVRVEGKIYIKEVKEKEQKAVVVGGNVVALLKELRACTPHELVFCRTDGTPLDPDTVSDWAAAIAKKAGFPDLTLHGLRHTNATLLRAAGVDEKMIQKRLGHHSLKMTWDYTHINLAMQQRVAKTLDRIIPVGHQKGTNLTQNGKSSEKRKPPIH